jgi:hypothetical protein
MTNTTKIHPREYILGILYDIRGDNEYPSDEIVQANASLLYVYFQKQIEEAEKRVINKIRVFGERVGYNTYTINVNDLSPQKVDKGSIDGRLKQEKVQVTVQDESERFIGKIKREWYMKGYEEGQQSTVKKIIDRIAYRNAEETFEDIEEWLKAFNK